METRIQNPGQDPSYYRFLKWRLILIVILVSSAPMIIGSGIILKQYASAYREKVHAHLEELVQKHKQDIDTFLNEKLNDIRFLASAYTFEAFKDEAFLEQNLKLLQRKFGPVFEDLGVITDAGLQTAYAGPFHLEQAIYRDAEWFKNAIKLEFYISDVFLGLRGFPHFIVAVKENWHNRPWILRATIDFMAFNSLVENLRIGETGFAFIVNRQGEFQTKPRFDAVPDKGAYRYFKDAGNGPGKSTHILERVDLSGDRHIYVAAALKDGDWLMIYQQQTVDAYSQLFRTQTIALIILLLSGVSIVVIAYFLSQKLVDRIALSDREKEILNRQMIEAGKLASIGELAAGIAHEINNPVAIMCEEAGWIQDLLEEEEFQAGENLGEFQRSLNQIKNQGRRCKDITHKLLSFARKTDSTAEPLHLNTLIQEVVALSAQRAKFSNTVIHTDLQQSLPAVSVSQTDMQQVLLNLLNNALDAMAPKGGEIRITTRSNSRGIIMEVADTGPGIPEANLQKIFDPFFTTKPVGQGTGLGLSICYGIIQKMGGKLTVESVLDQGTVFRVRIPQTISESAD